MLPTYCSIPYLRDTRWTPKVSTTPRAMTTSGKSRVLCTDCRLQGSAAWRWWNRRDMGYRIWYLKNAYLHTYIYIYTYNPILYILICIYIYLSIYLSIYLPIYPSMRIFWSSQAWKPSLRTVAKTSRARQQRQRVPMARRRCRISNIEDDMWYIITIFNR